MRDDRAVVNRSGRPVATLAVLLCLVFPSPSLLAAEGKVANLGGTMSAKAVDGAIRVLSVNSDVSAGDTLYTEKDAFARVKFADGGEVTLRPNTHFKVESFTYQADEPQKDNAVFSLLKGGLRALTGAIGKRRSNDQYRMQTSTATIGIRGTQFGLLFCQSDCAGITSSSGQQVEDGLHLDVAEGSIVVINKAGVQTLNAGQYGYVKDNNTIPKVSTDGVRINASTIQGLSSAGKSVGKDKDSPECTID